MTNEALTPQKEIFTLNEACDYLRVTREFLYLKRKKGELKTIKMGKKVLFLKSEIESFIQKSTINEVA